MKVAVIGAGNLGSALAKNASKSVEVIALKRRPERIEGVKVVTRVDEVEDCDVFFICLKPNVFRENLRAIGNFVKDKPVVSFAAGVKLDEMMKHIKNAYRAMTNIAIEERSILAYYPPEAYDHLSFLDAEFIECKSERELDVMTAYIGSSPAIVAYLLHSFILSALRDGLDYERSLNMAVEIFKASADLYKKHGLEQIVKKIATPGGTTIEGIIEIFSGSGLINALAKTAQKARRI